MSLDTFCREEPDERESIRLDLVGLAAEIATLSARIEEELASVDALDAAPLNATRQLLAERALSVLHPQTPFGAIATDAFKAALDILGDDQRQMLQLRRQVGNLRSGSVRWPLGAS